MTKHTARTPVPTRSRRRRQPAPVSFPMMAVPEPAEEPSPEPASGEPSPSSEALREMTKGIDVPLAVELEKALEQALAVFQRDHEVLVRKACDVPDSHMDLQDVIRCTFLGHVLQRLEGTKGRHQIERLVSVLLDQFVTSREQVAKLMGTLQ